MTPQTQDLPAPGTLSVTRIHEPDQVALVCLGDLDLPCSPQLEREARELLRSGVKRLVIDLRGVPFMDSSGLSVLLSLRNDAKRGGQELQLSDVPGPVRRVFQLTNTRGLFDWRD